MKIRLQPRATWGKQHGGGDFKIFANDGQIDEGMKALVKRWIDFFKRNKLTYLTVCEREGSHHWLMYIRCENADNAGRDSWTVNFGRFPMNEIKNDPDRMPGLLLQFREDCRNKVETPAQIELPETAAVANGYSRESIEAVLAMMIGRTGVVRETKNAAMVTRILGEELPWIATWPDDSNESAGTGLLFGDGKKVPSLPQELAPLVDDALNFGPEKLNLRGLAAMSETENTRRDLLRVALNVPGNGKLHSASNEALLWLFSIPERGRAEAFRCARPEQLPGILSSANNVTLAEFLDIKERGILLGAVVSSTVLAGLIHQSLKSSTAAVQAYLAHAGDLTGLKNVLPRELCTVWEAMQQWPRNSEGEEAKKEWRLPIPDLGATEELFTLLDGSNLLQHLSDQEVIIAARSGSEKAKRILSARLKKGTLPGDLADALIFGKEYPSQRPQAAPPSRWRWLYGINLDRFLESGVTMKNWGSWFDWWRKLVSLLFGEKAVEREKVLEAAVSARDGKLLQSINAPEIFIQLIDENQSGITFSPDSLSREESETLKKLVTSLFTQKLLFPRVAGYLDHNAWKWLDEHLQGNARVQASYIANALTDRKPLAPDWLRMTEHRLPRRQLLEQVSAWGRQPMSRSREEALRLIIGQLRARLRKQSQPEDEADWLHALLVETAPLGRIPRWDYDDIIVLLPILNPIDHVLREVLYWDRPLPERNKAECALLEELYAKLGADSFPMPPPPSKEICRLRPNWIKRLSELPNWQSFAQRLDS